jgi:hypothetical protein
VRHFSCTPGVNEHASRLGIFNRRRIDGNGVGHRVEIYRRLHKIISQPIGVAYAVWVGIGAVGVTIVGIVFFGETINVFKILCLILIIIGIVGLKALE